MTYNFDPDRWYDMQLADLDRRLAGGALTPARYADARAALERDYDAMLDRLDGLCRISGPDNLVSAPTPDAHDAN